MGSDMVVAATGVQDEREWELADEEIVPLPARACPMPIREPRG